MEEVRLCDQCGELPGTIDPQPYGRPTKGLICEACVDREKCELCGKIRPREEMIRYSSGWYCIGENMRRTPDAKGSRNKYRCYLIGERREEEGAADLVAEQESIYEQELRRREHQTIWLIIGATPLLIANAHDSMQHYREERPFRASRRAVRDLVGGVPVWRRLIKRKGML